MENWVFNKKEIHFIADLMIERLQSSPDNSELSVMNLFEQVLSADFLRVKHDDGFYIQGYKITDIEAPSDAWYQFTNTGKSDLLVFVADQSLTERKELSL